MTARPDRLGVLHVASFVPTHDAQVLGAAREGTILAGRARHVHARVAAAWVGSTDVLSLLAIVFAIPFIILAVGMPIALAVQLVLWLGRLL